MRVARDDERQRFENGLHHDGIVLSERLSGNQGTHVEKTIRLAPSIPIDDREIRSDGFGRIECHRKGIKQSARGSLEGGVRSRQMLLHQGLEGALAVPQRLRHVGVDLAGPIACVERDNALEKIGNTRNRRIKHVALVYRPFRSPVARAQQGGGPCLQLGCGVNQAFWRVTPVASSGASGCITPTIPCFAATAAAMNRPTIAENTTMPSSCNQSAAPTGCHTLANAVANLN